MKLSDMEIEKAYTVKFYSNRQRKCKECRSVHYPRVEYQARLSYRGRVADKYDFVETGPWGHTWHQHLKKDDIIAVVT